MGKGAANELPMPPHRLVTPDLIVRPAQGMFHLLGTLLDPHAQPVEADDLLHTRNSKRAIVCTLRSRSRQIRKQVERGQLGEGGWIGRSYDHPFLLGGSKGTDVQF